MAILFAVLVVLGFGFMVAARWPNSRVDERAAWVLWLIASVIWAWPLIVSGS